MPAYSKERTDEYRERIRAILTRKPRVSLREIKEALSKGGLDLTINYINKLVKKIHRERAERINRYTVGTFLANYEDKLEDYKEILWSILQKRITKLKESKDSDYVVTQIIKELRTIDKDVFDKLFEAGVFEKKDGQKSFEDYAYEIYNKKLAAESEAEKLNGGKLTTRPERDDGELLPNKDQGAEDNQTDTEPLPN